MQPTSQQISELRANFLKKLAEEGGDSVIHPTDLERIKTSDDWVRRFLLHHDLDMKLALNMMWETCEWRKEFGTNEISESNVRMDYMVDGGLFSRGKDIDGCTLLIFKCKLHVKGQRNFEELKRMVVYWFERLERECDGKPISVFFDMEGCGLSNMDMEYTKYLINLLKFYYPFFLNYILIYEMAWILNAAFKLIKSLLPEKAVAKMKMINKNTIKDFVPMEQALKCWGGEDDYVFSFVPENRASNQVINNISSSSKKVHFADGSPMSDNAGTFVDKETGGLLDISPSSCINFVKDGNDLTSTVFLTNTDEDMTVSYKMKTTAPEKFRVRPSAGCLKPGERGSVTVTLLPGFHLGGLARDKFLVMSMPVGNSEMSLQELTDLWRNTAGKPIAQHKLRCIQPSEAARNDSAVGNSNEIDSNQLTKLSSRINQLAECQSQLHSAVKRMQLIQLFTIFFVILMAIIVVYVLKKDIYGTSGQQCYKSSLTSDPDNPLNILFG